MPLWDDPQLNYVRARREAQSQRTAVIIAHQGKLDRREDRREYWRGWFDLFTGFFCNLAMYSNDSTLARQAMTLTAEKELKRQRQISEQNRLADQVRRQAEMDYLAARVADELEDRARRLRTT